MCAQYKPSLIAIQYFNTIFLVCSVILCQRLTVPLPVCLFLTIVNRGLFNIFFLLKVMSHPRTKKKGKRKEKEEPFPKNMGKPDEDEEEGVTTETS